jgi:hypothetical protein
MFQRKLEMEREREREREREENIFIQKSSWFIKVLLRELNPT